MFNEKSIQGKNYKCFFLDWDTNYFGINSARVNLTGPVDEKGQGKIIIYCNNYDFVTIENNNNTIVNNDWIGKKTTAFLADMRVHFKKELEDKLELESSDTSIMNNLPRNEQVIKIAENSFKYSRFLNDPTLPKKKASNLYLKWTESAFERDDKYFVLCKKGGKVAGYILFSIYTNISVIELIAVDKKYQGQGVGKSLINRLELFAKKKEVSEIQVGTQISNTNAINFYSRMGFTYTKSTSIYHM